MPIGTHLPLHQGLAGRVAETLEPVIITDYQTWPYRSKTLEKLPIRATVLVPMMRGGELIGVLGVHEVVGSDRIFTEADARLLSIFAANAAGAVHNARLLDALHASEERFRIAAGCASDIVYDWDLKADHADYFGVLFERSKAENKGWASSRKEYWELIHPDDSERIREALQAHFETGKPFSEEYRIRFGDGRYRSVADRATAIKNQKGTPIRLIGAVSDITARKEAEQMKSDFVSFVSHQLRTPLSGVKWLLELAIDMMDSPEDVRSYIMDARTSTDRLIGLVNDLLDVSRLERGKLQVNYGNVKLEKLTGEIVNELAPLISEKEQNVAVTAAAMPDLWADAQLVRQAILNLLSNAMKYTPRGGAIEIKIGQSGDRAVWSIKDTGIGIPKSDIEKLFEKFFRAGNVLAVETEGTGLGLYLVRLIVERFGGRVWCESEEGVGSTFLFALPLKHRG
jgi:signal transduction histidine kinase